MDVNELADLIAPEGPRTRAGAGRVNVRCPAHNDKTPSLTLWIDNDGKAALNCHAGCTQTDILTQLPPTSQQAVEATWKPAPITIIVPKRRHTPQAPTEPASPRIEAEHPYLNEKGDVAYIVRRYQGKQIRQLHPENGRTVNGRGDHPLIPYRLPDVIAANRAGDLIYVVEGEKDADTLAAYGITATCNVGGAGKWTENLNGWFAGAHIAILPDNDNPGQTHAAAVYDQLRGVAETCRIIQLPGLPDKGDVTDWLQTHTPQELEQLARQPDEPGEAEFQISPGNLIFDIPLEVESIWGQGQQSLWARGEPLMIYGPTGIGKTTLAGRLLLALIGVDAPQLLDYPIIPISGDQTVLYVAADRPRQAMRSLRRMTPTQASPTLAKRLRIEHQRQIWASEKDPEMLHRAAKQVNAAIVFLDSSKDLAGGPLKDEGPAKALMDAIQICIANNIDIAMLHHPRKATQENGGKRQLDLDDVYGSAWLTAGSGSVILVNGKPGSGSFRFEQLKAPANFIDPFDIAVDYETGHLRKTGERHLETWLEDHGMPTSIKQAVSYQYGIAEEDVNHTGREYKAIERQLENLVNAGRVNKVKHRPREYQWVGPMSINPRNPRSKH